LYNINHSVYKTVQFTSSFTPDVNMIYYVSEYLFDNDSEVEYMHINYFTGQNGEAAVKGNVTIYNEDGSILFNQDTVLVDRFLFLNDITPMIVNTQSGTKMIIRRIAPGPKETMVYGLAGTLHIPEESQTGLSTKKMIKAYPNPAQHFTRVDYKLPEGCNRGSIVIYDLNGSKIHSYTVDAKFDHLILSTKELPSGTYFYQLVTARSRSKSQKIVVIE